MKKSLLLAIKNTNQDHEIAYLLKQLKFDSHALTFYQISIKHRVIVNSIAYCQIP